MTTIDIGLPTLDNMDAAMESAGFTVERRTINDTEISFYSWDGDFDNGMILEYNYDSGITYYLRCWHYRNGSQLSQVYNLGFGGNTAYKLNYESLANGGIAMGYSSTSDVVYHFVWVAPKTAGDGWFGIPLVSNNYNWYIYDYGDEKQIQINQNTIYNISSIGAYSDDVQIVQVYNGRRFADNLYIALLHPRIDLARVVRATIGDNQFLLWNHYADSPYIVFAFELPS